MTLEEIKSLLPPVAIWMAGEAVEQGVKAHRKAEELKAIEKDKEKAGQPYSYSLAHAYNDGMRISADVLWRLFQSCSADCQSAIIEVSKHHNGYWGNTEKNFEAFVNALEKVKGYPVALRSNQ